MVFIEGFYVGLCLKCINVDLFGVVEVCYGFGYWDYFEVLCGVGDDFVVVDKMNV